MANIKIKDAPAISPGKNYKIPVGNTENDDARTITIQDLKDWMGDKNNGGGWSYTDLTNVPNLVTVEDVATINGKSILGGGDLAVSASTIDWVNVVGKPTIPTKTSELTNDADFVSYEAATNEFQEKLVSGVNISTVNGYDLLSGGNIVIQGGGGGVTWDDITGKPSFADVAFSGSYTDLDDKPDLRQKKIEKNDTGVVAVAFDADVFYFFNGGAITKLTFTLNQPSDSATTANTYHFLFQAGTGIEITWPTDILGYAGGAPPTFEANKWYEVSILEGFVTIISY